MNLLFDRIWLSWGNPVAVWLTGCQNPLLTAQLTGHKQIQDLTTSNYFQHCSLTRLYLEVWTNSLLLSAIQPVSSFRSSLKTILFSKTFSSVPLPWGTSVLYWILKTCTFEECLIIIIDNFCIVPFSGVPILTVLYNIHQHFLSFTNIIHIIMTSNNI